MTPTILTFTCSICGEPSTDICVFCTKDACSNHICNKCQRCSDCCECEIHLDEQAEPAAALPQTVVVAEDILMVEEEPAAVAAEAEEPKEQPAPVEEARGEFGEEPTART